MSSKYYVTRGKQNPKLPDAEKEVWEKLDRKYIQYLQQDLPCIDEENVSFGRDDVSVPSPWANVILFDTMLTTKDSAFGALAGKIKRDWRALIAMIALRDILDLKIEFIPMNLKRTNTSNTADKRFFDRMYDLRPQNRCFYEETSWNTLYFIKINHYTIGIITDSSLVCSLYEYKDNHAVEMLRNKGLIDENYELTDPLEYLKKDTALSAFMIEWLDTLRKYLVENCGAIDGADISGIANNILSFIEALLTSEIEQIRNEENKFVTIAVDKNSEIVNSYGLIRALKTVKIDLTNSMVMKKIAVEGKQDTFVLEFMSESLKMIKNAYEERCEIPEGQILDKNIIFEEQLYLFDTVNMGLLGGYRSEETAVIEKDDETYGLLEYQVLLPIKESVFDYIPSNIISRDINVDILDEDRIRITMNFYSEKQGMRALSKIYSGEDIIYPEFGGIYPQVEVWPYVKFESSDTKENLWKQYYVYYKKLNDEFDLRVKYDGMDWEEKARNTIVWEKEESGTPYVTVLEKIPTYVAVVHKDLRTEREKYYGLVFLKRPEVAEVNINKTAIVGVDFGTSSTTAFCEIQGAEPEQKFISFGHENLSSLAPMIGKNDNALYSVYSTSAYGEFIEKRYQERRSYPSLICKCDSGIHSLDSRIAEPFKWGKIKFCNRGNKKDSGRQPINNMKWGSEPIYQEAVESYLSQMARFIACTLARQGIGNIQWRFSYPTSLADIEAFKGKTENIIKSVNEYNIPSSISRKDSYYSESIVSAKFFKNTNDYICVDIGGGSSDISIWKGGYDDIQATNILQFSVSIASRKIFLNSFADMLLSKNEKEKTVINSLKEQFRKACQSKDISFDIDKYISDVVSVEEFARQIEDAFQVAGEDLQKFVADQETSMTVRKFYQTIAIGLWGILYYTAFTFKFAKDEFKGKHETIELHFAGTGSKMYDWLTGAYKERLEKAFSKLINNFLEKEGNESYSVNFDYTPKDLKTEAAIGLLKIKDKDEVSDTTVILPNCGTYIVDGKRIGADENIWDNDDIRSFYSKDNEKGIGDIHPDLDDDDSVFSDFINSFNNEIADSAPMKISVENLTVFYDRVKKIVNENKNNHTVVPMFIVKLQALIESLREN